MKHSWFIVLLAVVCNVVPLAYLETGAGKWLEGSLGVIIVNEHIKFAALLFLGSIPVALYLGLLATGGLGWDLPRGYLSPLCVLALVCVLGFFFSVDQGRAWLTGCQVFLLPFLVFLIVSSLKLEVGRACRLVAWMLPAGLLAALIGLDQFFGWTGWGNRFPRYGLGSVFFSPNLAAEYLALLLPLSLVGVAFGGKRLKWISVFLGVLMLLFFILTKARAAWVGLLGGVGLMMFMVLLITWRERSARFPRAFIKKALMVAATLAGLFLALLLLTPFWAKGTGDNLPGPTPPLQSTRFIQEFESIFHGQSNQRLEIWSDTWRMCRDEAGLIGLGPGQYRVHFPRFVRDSREIFNTSLNGGVFKQVRRAHNDYLQLLAEFGWVGLFAWFWLFGRVVLGAGRTIKEALIGEDWRKMSLVLCLLTTVLAFAVMMVFDFPSRMPATLLIGWVCLGLMVGLEPRDENTVAVALPPSWRPLALIAAALVLFVNWNLGWRTIRGNFHKVQGGFATERGEYGRAIVLLNEARKNVPWEESPWFQLFWLHWRGLDAQEALDVSRGHLEASPWYYPSMKHEMDALLHLGRREEARSSCRHILETFPYHPHADGLRKSAGLKD